MDWFLRLVSTASGKVILLVEDDGDIADLLDLHLSDEGHRVDVVDDGDEGLERALECNYDLIILDIMLPGTDGFDICRRLRQEKCHTPQRASTRPCGGDGYGDRHSRG